MCTWEEPMSRECASNDKGRSMAWSSAVQAQVSRGSKVKIDLRVGIGLTLKEREGDGWRQMVKKRTSRKT